MKRISVNIFFLILLTVASISADNGGTESPFSFGAGARELALGGAALTTADPFTAPYWNASLLARAERFSFGGFHSRLYESDVAYQYLGVAIPTMDIGGFGFGLFRLGIEGIEKRDANNLFLKEINDNRLAFYFGYGKSISSYDVGLALTLEHHSLDDYSVTSSPGLNLSVSRQLTPNLNWLPEVAVSITGRNIIRPTTKIVDESVKYPYSADVGMSVRLLPSSKWDQNLTLSTRATKVDWIDPELAISLEYSTQEILHLRGAVQDNKLSFGAGLCFKSISFDYALVDRDLGSLHMFSITLDFGKAVSQKRILREKRREAQFNDLMKERLTNRNREMVSELVTRGEKLIQTGQIEQANVIFDRALFLAGANGLDTAKIYQLVLETEKKLQQTKEKQVFETCIDSAQAKLAAEDYLSARYFANLVLVDFPNSPEARRLLDQADVAIEQSTTKDQMIENQLLLADSLLSYGKSNQAVVILRAVSQVVEDDNRVQLTLKRAEFDYWRELADAAFSRADYNSAQAALDSALSRFPEHPWCLKLRTKIEQKLSRPTIVSVKAEDKVPEPLSQEMLKEVDETYKNGQSLFKQGKLSEAISEWEKVDVLAPGYMSVCEYLVNAYKFVGVELYTQNRLKEAITIWKKAAKLAPNNSEITNYIKRTENEITRLQELSYDDK